jgi:hypothetical protein
MTNLPLPQWACVPGEGDADQGTLAQVRRPLMKQNAYFGVLG